MKMVKETEEGRGGRKPMLQEPEGVLSKWGLALHENEVEGNKGGTWSGKCMILHALACLISSAHAAGGAQWTPSPLRFSTRLPERINDISGIKRQKIVKIVQEEPEKT